MRFRRKMVPLWAIGAAIVLMVVLSVLHTLINRWSATPMPRELSVAVPIKAAAGSIFSVGEDGKLYTITKGSGPAPQNTTIPTGTHLPRMETGMILVYDSAGDLMKIRSSYIDAYFMPLDGINPKYKNGTWFECPDNNGKTQDYNIDTPDGMIQAKRWIAAHPSVKNPDALEKSLTIQRGSQSLILYTGKLTS